jgi:hypothetical protein
MLQGIFKKQSRQSIDEENKILPGTVFISQDRMNALEIPSLVD